MGHGMALCSAAKSAGERHEVLQGSPHASHSQNRTAKMCVSQPDTCRFALNLTTRKNLALNEAQR